MNGAEERVTRNTHCIIIRSTFAALGENKVPKRSRGKQRGCRFPWWI